MNETNGWDVLAMLFAAVIVVGPLCLMMWLGHKENTRD